MVVSNAAIEPPSGGAGGILAVRAGGAESQAAPARLEPGPLALLETIRQAPRKPRNGSGQTLYGQPERALDASPVAGFETRRPGDGAPPPECRVFSRRGAVRAGPN
ncbi:hypothetical protein GCM10007067_14370 [Lysobacter bugurensis]|uniref:Uncharacterized protein n=1 Tax=Cognatilysobacter bugurensis TaxID=543356 RepID=A0A918W7Q4_9GAMM|nr:hypothetical protein GCM10007067_14370 [Lysobacter bugurensis]